MVIIKVKNATGQPYAEVRDSICRELVGNKAFVDCDIIVSDCSQSDNEITITLGDDESHNLILNGEFTDMGLIGG